MITIEQAQEHLPVGARVRHRLFDRVGEIAPGQLALPSPKQGYEIKTYSVDRDGICCAIHVQWDSGRTEWAGPWDLEKIKNGEDDGAADAFNAELKQVGRDLGPEFWERTWVKTALWAAYAGNRDTLQEYLAKCAPETVEKLAAGAAILTEEARRLKDQR
ncbi:hypothetical protein [Streptosporangium sp. NPDC002607]